MSIEREYVEVRTAYIVQEIGGSVLLEEQVVETKILEALVPGPQGPPGSGSGVSLWEPEAAEALSAGQVVAVDSNGKATLANANSAARDALGLARISAGIGSGAEVLIAGVLTLSNWTSATGAATLVTGSEYWLTTTSGRMSTSPPSGAGISFQKIGRAISSDTLVIEVEKYGRKAV